MSIRITILTLNISFLHTHLTSLQVHLHVLQFVGPKWSNHASWYNGCDLLYIFYVSDNAT